LNFDKLTDHLKSALANPLPVEDAQRLMTPASRQLEIRYFSVEPLRKAAVLICLFPVGDRTHTILIERTQDAGPHSGQIAFPGGKHENNDSSLIATAIREANEELGINGNITEVLGHLSPVNIPVSGFSVLPVIACLPERPKLIPNPEEVKSVLMPDLLNLLSNKAEGNIMVRNINLHVPFYSFNNTRIWGATAMVLSELECVLKN